MLTYRIMEDLLNSTGVEIHLETCSVYQNNSGDTSTTKWHSAGSLSEAQNVAEKLSKKYSKGWKKADCCLRFA